SGASEIADWVVEQNIPHLFLTNTTSKPRHAILEKLKKFGINTTLEHILTPPVAAVSWLEKQNIQGKLALFVQEPTKSEFNDFSIATNNNDKDIVAVVIGDLAEAWDFATLNKAFRYLMSEPTPVFVSLGLTRYWKGTQGLQLDVAPFTAALQCASGVEPIVMGKPASAFYQTALDILGVNAQQTVMIGDDIRGDIEGAQQAGLKAILVKTGKFRTDDLKLGVRPDAIFSSIVDLPEWWACNR
ncbi:MAG: TIGR01458 family HAD-type hydrolase, partial [Gammaproteobacteria bacterium]|nr:TIGR01458 family HAD-type hydrolase [Gammaproteobacteria bacterium]